MLVILDKDQEDHSSNPAWANSSQDPISKKLITKKGLVEWLKVKVLSLSSSTKNKKVDFKVECGGIRL
jgi:hypothetical protein